MNMHVGGSKFKVGQRVKCIGEDERTFGKVGTLIKYDKSAFAPYLVAFLDWREGHGANDNEWWLAADDVEPAPLFAVGDKVRVVKNNGAKQNFVGHAGSVVFADVESASVDLGRHGTRYFDNDEIEPTYTSCAAAEVDNLADEYGGGRKRETLGDILSAALARQNTLTIQAGRYYKTRDGRKVGPMEHRHAGFTWRNHGEVRYVDAEGKHIYGLRNCDLIAEWPAVAAQQPTTIADIVRKHSGSAIVCLIENGQPKPSTLPFVHLNKDAAATEAARLAGIHKGQEFGVYACVDVRKAERVYDHEWQRLAAGGQKIGAIRELRGMTGLGLATTKGAVEDWLKREAA